METKARKWKWKWKWVALNLSVMAKVWKRLEKAPLK
jgi:hypothetical protein